MTFIFHFQEHLSKDNAGVENKGTASTRLPGFYSIHHTYMSGCFLLHEDKGTSMNQEKLFEEGVKKLLGGGEEAGQVKAEVRLVCVSARFKHSCWGGEAAQNKLTN